MTEGASRPVACSRARGHATAHDAGEDDDVETVDTDLSEMRAALNDAWLDVLAAVSAAQRHGRDNFEVADPKGDLEAANKAFDALVARAEKAGFVVNIRANGDFDGVYRPREPEPDYAREAAF